MEPLMGNFEPKNTSSSRSAANISAPFLNRSCLRYSLIKDQMKIYISSIDIAVQSKQHI